MPTDCSTVYSRGAYTRTYATKRGILKEILVFPIILLVILQQLCL